MSVRRLNNPEQSNPTLGVKFHKGLGVCCGDTTTNCAYDVEPAVLTNVTAITFNVPNEDGVDVPLTVTFPAANTPAEIRKAIAKAFQDNGVDPYYKGDDWKGVTVEGTRIRVIGTVPVIDITVDGAVIPTVQKCNFATKCKYKFAFLYDTDAGMLSPSALGGTQIGTTAGYATGASATVIADVTAAVTGAGFALASAVTVMDDTISGAYTVTIDVVGNSPIFRNGSSLTSCDCSQTFVA